MYRIRRTIWSLILGIAFSATLAYAVPPLSQYTPAETLDPSCAPGDSNCSVDIGSGASSVWGGITGTLSDQTDLQSALNAKFNTPSGTTSQYIRGDGTLAVYLRTPITIENGTSLFSTDLNAGLSTSGAAAIYLGINAGRNATNAGISNFIGQEAGRDAAEAYQSNFLGNQAGYQATNANSSNFIGSSAGYQATNAANAVFIGLSSGNGATNASHSIFLGYNSGYLAANAANSIFIGNDAGQYDTVDNTQNGEVDGSILIGNNSHTGGFSNSIVLGNAGTNTAANQLMITPLVTEVVIGGADSYITFTNGAHGAAGYGFRDNGGTLEYKNLFGTWTAFSSGAPQDIDTTLGVGNIVYDKSLIFHSETPGYDPIDTIELSTNVDTSDGQLILRNSAVPPQETIFTPNALVNSGGTTTWPNIPYTTLTDTNAFQYDPGSEFFVKQVAGVGANGYGNVPRNQLKMALGLGDSAGISTDSYSVGSTFIGNFAGAQGSGKGSSNAANSIFLGTNAGYTIADSALDNTADPDDFSILIGNNTSTGGFSNSIALGANATNTASNQFMIGSTQRPIDTTRINGSASTQCTITSGTGIACTSDERLKTNISDLSGDTLSKLLSVRTITYNWLQNPDSPSQIGFLAQDLEQYFPELVATDSDGYKSVYYAQMTPILTEAIREMNSKITDLTDLTKTNTWRDALIHWFGSAGNGITSFFSKEIHTDTICVKKSDGSELCMNGDQLEHVLSTNNMTISGSTTSTSGGIPTDTQTDQVTDSPADTTPPEDTQSTSEPTPVIENTPSDTPPTDAATAPVQTPTDTPSE